MPKKTKKILDLLWPPFCIGCQTNTENFDSEVHSYLCPDCLEKLSQEDDSGCAICKSKKGVKYNLCPKCADKLKFRGIIKGGSYQNPILKETIHTFKYKGIKDLSLPLAFLLIQKLRHFFQKQKKSRNYESSLDWTLVPVPLTNSKRRKRGFNQAEILAQHLAKIFAIPIKTDIIKKVKDTKAQMEIDNRKLRKKNLQNAFSLNQKQANNLRERKVILVDDVATTGATLNECAKTLTPLTKEIWGIVAAT